MGRHDGGCEGHAAERLDGVGVELEDNHGGSVYSNGADSECTYLRNLHGLSLMLDGAYCMRIHGAEEFIAGRETEDGGAKAAVERM